MLGLRPVAGQEEDNNRKMVSVTFVQKANMDKNRKYLKEHEIMLVLFWKMQQMDTKMLVIHRYTREIPEPVPFLSRHGAQIGGLLVFPVIK